jgi:hypothetical protein
VSTANFKDGDGQVPLRYNIIMTIAKRLSFTSPDDYYSLPDVFIGAWREFQMAENDGKRDKINQSKKKYKK